MDARLIQSWRMPFWHAGPAVRRFGMAAVVLTCLVGASLAPRVLAEESPVTDPAATAVDASPIADAASAANVKQLRDELLRWVEEDVYGNVLYRPEEVEALDERIRYLAPTPLAALAEETGYLRNVMKSPDWQATNKFFKFYKSLDGVLTKPQQYELAAGASALPPREVERIMRSLIEERLQLLVSHQVSQLQNQVAANTRVNFLADQERMRNYALQQASTTARNYFPAHQASAPRNRSQYQVPPPLITSRQMAQYVVFSSFFGGRR